MALPPGITPKTVTLGIASFADGSLATGRATISMPVNVLHTPTNRPIFSSEITQQFVDGAATFNLCPTDAPGLNRVDWAYKLKVEIQGATVQPEVIYFLLPTAGPDVVDLDGLVTVPSSAGTPISVDVLTTADFAPALLDELNDTSSDVSSVLRAAFGSAVRPEMFGAKGDGVTDDTAAMQTAVSFAETLADTGRPVTMALDGHYLLNKPGTKGVALTPNNSGARGRISIVGTARARITLTANTPLFLITTKQAKYDTFQKITVSDLQIVASGTAHEGGVIIGNILPNGTNQTYLNYADITVRRVTCTNLFEEASGATSQAMGIMLIGQHDAALEATQTSTKNIVVEDVEVFGGAGLANVCSFGSALVGGVNHYYDRIMYRRCRHVIATVPTTNGPQTSYFICGGGFGDYCEIVDCYSKNISDDGVEIGAMQTILLERVTVEDAFLEHFLFRNFHALQDPDNQVVNIIDCRTTVSPALVAAAGASNTRYVSYNWLANAGAFGTFNFVRPVFLFDGGSSTKSYPDSGSNFIGTRGIPIKSLSIAGAKVRYRNYTADRPTNHDVSIIHAASTSARSKVTIRDLDVKLDGITVPSTAQTLVRLIRIDGDTTLDIDNLTCDVPAYTAASGGLRLIEIGSASGALVRGRIRGFNPKTGTASGVGNYGVYVNSTANLTLDRELYVEQCDFTGMATATKEIFVDTTQRAFVKALDVAWKTVPTIATVAVGASPYTYVNADPYPRMVTVSGGTVTGIDVWGITGSAISTGLTAGTFILRPGQLLRITYSAVPTVLSVPLH